MSTTAYIRSVKVKELLNRPDLNRMLNKAQLKVRQRNSNKYTCYFWTTMK